MQIRQGQGKDILEQLSGAKERIDWSCEISFLTQEPI